MLFETFLAAGTGRVVHVSTDEVYGSIGEGSWAEGAGLDTNHHPAQQPLASADIRRAGDGRITQCNYFVTECRRASSTGG